jgi:hypothetical protein
MATAGRGPGKTLFRHRSSRITGARSRDLKRRKPSMRPDIEAKANDIRRAIAMLRRHL